MKYSKVVNRTIVFLFILVCFTQNVKSQIGTVNAGGNQVDPRTYQVTFERNQLSQGANVNRIRVWLRIPNTLISNVDVEISSNPFGIVLANKVQSGDDTVLFYERTFTTPFSPNTNFPLNTPVEVATFVFTTIPSDVILFGVSGESGVALTVDGVNEIMLPLSVSLPVEFSYFTASKRDLTSVLLWETASEINNDYFDVERSADGRSFQKIGKVKGNGTTTETQNYEFIDREPLAGINYYRLKQVDYNGDYEYSNVETVDFRDGTEGDVSIFPNPAADYVNVSLDRSYDGIRITNQLGQLVEVLPAHDYESNQFRLDLTGYAPGVYFLEAKLGLEIVNKQFVKVK